MTEKTCPIHLFRVDALIPKERKWLISCFNFVLSISERGVSFRKASERFMFFKCLFSDLSENRLSFRNK